MMKAIHHKVLQHTIACLITISLSSTVIAKKASWPVSGGDLDNSRNAVHEQAINPRNVHKLKEGWVLKLSDLLEEEMLTSCGDNLLGSNELNLSINNSPAVVGNKVIFTDWCGYITAVNKETGKKIWRKNFLKDLSMPGYSISLSRNTPAIIGDQVLVGNTYYLTSPLCRVNKAANRTYGGHPFSPNPLPESPTGAVYDATGASVFACHEGDGAIVLSLNIEDGSVNWRKKIHNHPAAKITGSISVKGNVAYVPVASWEEEWSRLYPNIYELGNNNAYPYDLSNSAYPNNVTLLDADDIDLGKPYPCCSFRGKVVAMDISNDGEIIWEHNTSIGLDPDNEIKNKSLRKALLAGDGKGYFGVSTYGNTMPIDKKNNQLYYASAETYTAPPILTDCEKVRRMTGKANPTNKDLAKLPGKPELPEGIKSCNELNQALKTYHNAIVALDLDTGKVNWSYHTRQYDPWTHACDQPDFTLGSWVVPVIMPDPVLNVENNCNELIGPDYGFGHQPVLVQSKNKKGRSIVVAGNKDGRLFALNAKNGKPIWKNFDPEAGRKVPWTRLDPGAIYGGMQFGLATDGKRIFTGTANNHNMGRDVNIPFVAMDDFREANFDNNPNYTDLYPLTYPSGFTVPTPPQMVNGLHHRFDGDSGQVRPAPGPRMPYFGIATGVAAFGSPTSGAGLPNVHPFYPDGVNTDGSFEPFVTGPVSGPMDVWRLIRPPKDIIVDCINVFNVRVDVGNPETQQGPTQDISECTPGPYNGSDTLYTIAGKISAVDVKSGRVLWQRPATDGIVGLNVAKSTMVVGSVTHANGVVFAGISDGLGTMVGLNARDGRLLFLFQAKEDKLDGSERVSGGFDAGPSVVDGTVFWGIGTGTSSAFLSDQPDLNQIINLLPQDLLTNYSGNRLYTFELPDND